MRHQFALGRREVIALLGGAAVPSFVWPLLVRAQQAPKVAVVGALVIGNTDPEAVLAGV